MREHPGTCGPQTRAAGYARASWNLRTQTTNSNDVSDSMLHHTIQPPELARLNWSLTMTLTTITTNYDPQCLRRAGKLSVLALRTAGANLPIFGTEDLVRLAIVVACLILSTNARNIRLVSL